MTYKLSRELIDDPVQLRRFIAAAFAHPGVGRLDLYPETGVARSTVSAAGAGRPPVLPPLYLRPAPPAPIRIFRHGRTLSTWELVHRLDGRARFRHAVLRSRPEVGETLQELIGRARGVESMRVAPEAASLIVSFNGRKMSWSRLLQTLEAALIETWPETLPTPRSARMPALGAMGVLLAAAADSGVPGLDTAMMGWTLLRAMPLWRDTLPKLARGRVDLSAVQSARALLTLIQGEFLPGELADYLSVLWNDYLQARGGRAAPVFADQIAPVWLLAALIAYAMGGAGRSAAVLRADLEGPEGIPLLSLLGGAGALAGFWGTYANIAIGQVEMLATQTVPGRKKKVTPSMA